MEDQRFSLQELTEAAGVSVRTVRYYIAEGLLPPPVSAGSRSFYSVAHRDRLRLIGLLKDAFLPLREIRRRLAGLDDRDLAQAIEEASGGIAHISEMMPPPYTQERDESSAAEYIAGLSRREAPRRAHAPPATPAPRYAPPHPAPIPRDQAWRRIPIGDDAELLITDDLYTRKEERIEALVEWARRILAND